MPDPTGPSIALDVDVRDASVVVIDAVPSGFGGSGRYTRTWAVTDAETDTVVASGTFEPADNSSAAFPLSRLTITSDGDTSRAAFTTTVTFSRNGQTATQSVSSEPTWTTPTSPLIRELRAPEGEATYSLGSFNPTTCTPVGTKIHIQLSGERDTTTLTFVEGFVPFDPHHVQAQPVGDPLDGRFELVTTSACWSLVWIRGSLTQIHGSARAEFTWE